MFEASECLVYNYHMPKQKTIYSITKNKYWKKKAIDTKIKGPIHFIENKQQSKKDTEQMFVEILAANRLNIPFVIINPSSTLEHKKYIKKVCKKLDLFKDVCAIFFTSGSTGKPKPIQLTNKILIDYIKAITKILNLGKNVVMASLLPLNMKYGFFQFVKACYLDARLIYLDKSGGYDNLVRQVIKEKVEYLIATPYHWDKICEVLKKEDIKLNLAVIFFCGSKINKNTLAVLLKRCARRVFSGYGSTEASGTYFEHSLIDKPSTAGRAVPGCKIKVIRLDKKECKPFEEGEILIYGKFTSPSCKNPFYTGDIGYKDKEGDLFVVGRKDEQLKIKGYRTNCSQFEAVYNKYNTCVFGIPAVTPGWHEVVVVFETKNSIKKIKKYVQKILPPINLYCRPIRLFTLEKFPLTLTGKIDRLKIKDIFINKINRIEIGVKYLPPKTKSEIILANIWQEVLKIENIGIKDNFFDLGADSLKTVELVSKMTQAGFKVSLISLFQAPSIAELLKTIKIPKDKKASMNNIYPVQKPNFNRINHPFNLTPLQRAYLIGRENLFELGSVADHRYLEIETTGHIKKIEQSLQKLINYHPMLRMVILPDARQKILKNVPVYKIKVDDLRGISKKKQQVFILKERQRMSHQVLSLDKWPLFEIKACRLDNSTYRLFLSFDGIGCDYFSFIDILRGWELFYKNHDFQLPKLNFSFSDYMLAYEKFKTSAIYIRDKKFWLKKINNFPGPPVLPLKKDPKNIKKPHFISLKKELNEKDWRVLKSIARKKQITISVLLFVVYSEVLSYWSNQQHFAVNITLLNRYSFHPDVDKIVGNFTSLLLMEINQKANLSFWKRAKLIQNTFIEALEHKHFDGVDFIHELAKRQNLRLKAIMPVVFTSALNTKTDDVFAPKSSFINKIKFRISQAPQMYLWLIVVEEQDRLIIRWNYVKYLFENNVVKNMSDHYMGILQSLVKFHDKDPKISLPAKDKQFISRYNKT